MVERIGWYFRGERVKDEGFRVTVYRICSFGKVIFGGDRGRYGRFVGGRVFRTWKGR